MQFTVVGLGYVGLSMSVLLARNYCVRAVDNDSKKIEKLQKYISPIHDEEIIKHLNDRISLNPTTNLSDALAGSDFCIIATPTDYDETSNYFDTKSVEDVAQKIVSIDPSICIVIKSTIPIGFVEQLRKKLGHDNIYFSPEFLREGQALKDNLYPSRIIVGGKTERARTFAEALKKCSMKENCKIILTETKEAESIKLFANSYLAMRVSFFNELDSFCMETGISTEDVINGVCYEPRIGLGYNNPSFGYGGYCFPKDTKQMRSNFGRIPQNLFSAIVETNSTRKRYLVDKILESSPKKVGIYKLSMKKDSDNYREAAVIDIAKSLMLNNISVNFYDENVDESEVHKIPKIADLGNFLEINDLIVANRWDAKLEPFSFKVFTRDVFEND